MAIQGGAKELKYPLPNWAQLSAQQSAAAASSGGSAAASAFSTNRNFAANKMRVQAQLADSAADRQFRAQENFQDRSFRAQSQLEGQRFDAERQQALFGQQQTLQTAGQEFSAGQSQLDRDFQTQQFEREIDAGIEQDIQRGRLELPPDAQAELDKLEAGRRDAPKIVDSPEQQAEFDRQYEARKREIMRTAKPPAGPSPTEEFNRNTIYVGEDGQAYDQPGPGRKAGRMNAKGEFQPNVDTTAEDKQRAEAEKKQQEAEQKRREAEQKINDEIYKEADELWRNPKPGQKKYGSFDEARDEVLKNRRAGGASAPEAAPEAPPDQKGPVLPQSGSKTTPSAPQVGMGESVEARSSAPVSRQPEVLPGSPSYQAPSGPATSTLPQTPDSGKGVVATPVGGSAPAAPPPPGFPPGTQTIAPDAYMLPDGRIVRRTGK